MLRVEDLNKTYHTGDHVYPVLKHLSFRVEKGEFVSNTVNPSSSMKS